MAYQVDNFNGTFLVSVEDGTIDTTTDLRFVGKNYAGYGEVQNENFLHLLQNFSNTSAPPKAITGQIWYDSSTKKLKFYDGSRFKVASGAEVSASAPTGLAKGDFWFDESANQLYTWSGTEYVLIGPAAAPEFGTSAAVGQVVQDNTGGPQTIVKLVSGGDTIAIASKTDFVLGSVNPITGFSRIKKGITLVNTDSLTGVTTASSQYYFWGTASNSLKLNGIAADQFLTKGDLRFTEQIAFPDAGITVGDSDDLLVFVETQDPFYNEVGGNPLRDEDQVVIEQAIAGQPITFRIRVNETTKSNVLKVKSSGVYPGSDGNLYLGSASKRWGQIYSTDIYGALTGNVTGNTTGTHIGAVYASDETEAFDPETKTFYGTLGTPSQRSLVYGDLVGEVTGSAQTASKLGSYSPSISTSPDTVVVRDSKGNIYGTTFQGTALLADRLKIDNLAVDTDATYRTAKTTAVANSIAARDGSGNLSAVLFDGTATAARYADLAEKYLTDKEYEPGTVVSVCEHGDHEVEACQWGQRAIGVVSTNPAFMMNKDLEGGTYIALKGRVPVKVTGAVKKGQRLIAGNDGTAVAGVPHANDVFAIALETNNETSVKLIEAVIL